MTEEDEDTAIATIEELMERLNSDSTAFSAWEIEFIEAMKFKLDDNDLAFTSQQFRKLVELFERS